MLRTNTLGASFHNYLKNIYILLFDICLQQPGLQLHFCNFEYD